jgi:molybdopterin molybdotransferase
MSRLNNALTVEAALALVLQDTAPSGDSEWVDLMDACGRVLAAPVSALLTQPPFTASAMDGYAVRAADVAKRPATLTVIGEAAAGRAFPGQMGVGEAVRIFTGAPLPEGADSIVIQEDTRRDALHVIVQDGVPEPEHIRAAGGDFRAGDYLLDPGQRLTPRDVTLAAAMGHAKLSVLRRPKIAILATGDELVMPGEVPRPDQIVCSNPFGVVAMVRAAGGEPLFLGIAKDTRDSLKSHIAKAIDADVIVTLGGASVGDHDLVGPVLRDLGMNLAFWKIAMRPGKPLMFGRLGKQRVLGLPGNPVSSLITGRLFLVPLIRCLLGLNQESQLDAIARTTVPLAANGPRAHFMRAALAQDRAGNLSATPVRSQDSSLLTPLRDADCLIVRPIGALAVAAGDAVPIMHLDI